MVGFLGDINLQALSPSKEEIASVFTVPLVDLSDPSKLSFREAGFRGREVHLPVFQAKDPKNPSTVLIDLSNVKFS